MDTNDEKTLLELEEYVEDAVEMDTLDMHQEDPMWVYGAACNMEESDVVVLAEKQGDTLYCLFHVPGCSDLEAAYEETDRIFIDGPLLHAAREELPAITEWLGTLMMQLEQIGEAPLRTVFGGVGLGGCMAALMAYNVTPTALFTFGMPAFSSRLLEDGMRQRAAQRQLRHPDSAEFVFKNYLTAHDPASRTQLGSGYVHLGDVQYRGCLAMTVENPPRWYQWLSRKLCHVSDAPADILYSNWLWDGHPVSYND